MSTRLCDEQPVISGWNKSLLSLDLTVELSISHSNLKVKGKKRGGWTLSRRIS